MHGNERNAMGATLLVTDDAAAYCLRRGAAVAVSTLKTYRSRQKGPPFYRGAGKQVLYKPADLDAWIESLRIDPAVDPSLSG
jgi:hypothetical protein